MSNYQLMYRMRRRRRGGVASRRQRRGDRASKETVSEARNYADNLIALRRFEEAKTLLLKTVPVARRTLGEGHRLALTLKKLYAEALYSADGATLDDIRESVGMLEEMTGTARRVFGGAHPLTDNFEYELERARAALRAANLLDGLVYPVDPSWQRHSRVGVR